MTAVALVAQQRYERGVYVRNSRNACETYSPTIPIGRCASIDCRTAEMSRYRNRRAVQPGVLTRATNNSRMRPFEDLGFRPATTVFFTIVRPLEEAAEIRLALSRGSNG